MIFRFKQFEIKHSDSLLKVTTDAVLLGALVRSESGISNALDIGTGCGVIALIVAQKYKGTAIDAIEIDQASYEEAAYNFSRSTFASQLNAIHSSLQQFETSKKYELIFSNPPYFETPDFSKGNNKQDISLRRKSLATQFTLKFEELLSFSRKLLQPMGQLWVIIPYASKEKFLNCAAIHEMFLVHDISIRSNDSSLFIRSVLCLGLQQADTISTTDLSIYNSDGSRHQDYSHLTRDYYL